MTEHENVAYDTVIQGLKRDKIYDEVISERNYQDNKWGGSSFDDTQTHEDWIKYIKEYAEGVSDRASLHPYRTRLVKVAALAFAAIESYDRKNTK